MSTNYYDLTKTELKRILAAVTGVASVQEGLRPAEKCAAFPAVCYALTQSTGDRAVLSMGCELRTLEFTVWLYASPTTDAYSHEDVEKYDCDIRAAFENDNVKQTSLVNSGGVVMRWHSPNTIFDTDLERKINAEAITVNCEIRRPYAA